NIKTPTKITILFIAYNVSSYKTISNKKKSYSLEVISSILTSGNSSRITKQLERQQELVISASSSYDSFNLYDGLFSLEAIPAVGKSIDQVKTALVKQLEDLKTTLVTQQELERVKAGLIANKVYEQDSISYQAMVIGMLESINLSWKDYENYIESLKKVTPEEIKTTAQKYFTNERLTTAVLEPQEIKTTNL
ncbi:MAG: insulinase family protein, partial [Gammaproteobacteria bacterium]|nr:insulinase family protein [Gammaproteobacteria bacterium]